MHGDAGQDGLRRGLDSMVALESWLEETLALLSGDTERYLEAPTIIGRLRSVVTGQREALEAHIQALGDTDVPPLGPAISVAFEPPPETPSLQPGQEPFATLSAVAAAFARVALSYAVLHGLAHRSYQIPTADLADQHRVNYVGAVHAIHRAVGDVAVHELQQAGHACRCQCPACGPGVCICWHVHGGPNVTGVGASTEGIVVRVPRTGSNAERAGLRRGDVIVAVDGREVRSYEDLRDGMGAHQPGEEVTLLVRRGTGDPQDLTVTR